MAYAPNSQRNSPDYPARIFFVLFTLIPDLIQNLKIRLAENGTPQKASHSSPIKYLCDALITSPASNPRS
jgi:hypothetical protein